MNKNIVLRDKIVSTVIIFVSMVLMAGAIYFIVIRPKGDPVSDSVMEVMPDLVGYNYAEVRETYAEYFDVEVGEQEYSDEFPEGAILEQDFPAGTEYVKGKTTVQVTLSRGSKPEETAVVAGEAEDPEETVETVIPESRPALVETDADIKNPPAEFESLVPDDELEFTIRGLYIPYGRGDDLLEELYSILRRRGADAGFLYYDPQTGGSIEYNADERFASGSIIKAIYARSILGYDLDLDAEYEMTEELLNSPYELIDGKPVGTMFTAGELIEAALVKSDNTAYKMLYHYIGYDKFNRYSASLGLRHRMTEDNYWFRMTVRESAIYFKEIYNFTKQHVNGGLMLECMSNTEFREMFSSALPEKKVAEKYGYLPQEDFFTLGNCAIISGETDYLVVMYIRGKTLPPNTQPFRDVAVIIDELHELIQHPELAEQYWQSLLDSYSDFDDDDDVAEEVEAEEEDDFYDWW